MASLFADEDFDARVVDYLRQWEHDVLTAIDAGIAGKGVPDADVLKLATSLARAVVTFNYFHFVGLHARQQPHAGIIVCTRDDDRHALAARIHQAIGACASLSDQLIRVKP